RLGSHDGRRRCELAAAVAHEPARGHRPGTDGQGSVRAVTETFWKMVCEAADRAPDRVVLADDYGRTLTTSELRDAAEAVAACLDVAPGDVVSWQLPTTLEAPVMMVALARVGAIQNPIIPFLRHREVGSITA